MTCPRCTTPLTLDLHPDPVWRCPACRTVLDFTAYQLRRLRAIRIADERRLLDEAETLIVTHAANVDTRAAKARWGREEVGR